MIRIKRQERIMIVVLVVMVVITVYISLVMVKGYKKENETNQILNQQAPVSEEKTKQLEKFAAEIIDKYPIENHAMVIIETQLIANDQYKRYLVEVETVAVNQQVGKGVYTYYIVIQENKEGKFYIPPFGVEILKDTTDPLKREIIISMMKVVNGWGATVEEFEERWGKIPGSSKVRGSQSGRGKDNTNLEVIYFMQSVLKYMTHYLEHYSEAIEYNDLVYVEDFLEEVPEFYEQQYKEIELLENEGIQRDVLKAEIVEIIPASNLKDCIVSTKVDVRTHIQNKFLDLTTITKYKVRLIEDSMKIVKILESNSN
ncbi:MAG: TcaA NTF2-like domain-containing protein [Cellulosilyticaceae bacterium]